MLIEDHSIVAEGIAKLLKSSEIAEEVIHFADGETALAYLNEHKVMDIILLDINLPDYNGIDLCQKIKSKYPSIGIIALSSFGQPGIIRQMLQNGAQSYLMKNTSATDLHEAIQKVAEGKQFLPDSIKQILDNQSELMQANTPVFTRREKEVLALIAEGFTTQEIGEKLFISPLTVNSHRKSLMEKTQTKNTAQLIKYCFEFGLLI